MLERPRAWRFGAEVVGSHRTGVGDHPGVRQRGDLKGCEVGVAEPALPGLRQRAEVQPVEHPRPPVAAAHRHRDVDVFVRGHPRDGRQPLVVGCREARPARGGAGVDHDAVPPAAQPRDCPVERGGIGREPRRRIDAERDRHRRAAKNPESSAPHSSARTPPDTVA
jgi:hypothetical protein